MRRAGHGRGRLPDGKDGHARRDEDELPALRRRNGADAKGVAAPPDGIADETARLDGGDGGAKEPGEEVARVQSGRSLPKRRG
jgi:hypothetical protein